MNYGSKGLGLPKPHLNMEQTGDMGPNASRQVNPTPNKIVTTGGPEATAIKKPFNRSGNQKTKEVYIKRP